MHFHDFIQAVLRVPKHMGAGSPTEILICPTAMLASTEPQRAPGNMAAGSHTVTVLKKIKKVDFATAEEHLKPKMCKKWLPSPSKRRKMESLQEHPLNLQDANTDPLQQLGANPTQPQTVFYLAYGSNLSSETFQGRRGIRPLSQLNVVVPELGMTFDLAGLPYVEPCFANTKYRNPAPSSPPSASEPEKSDFLPSRSKKPKYHKSRWKKGLVGVVYEVTKADFAHIIATEGGGASYQDVLVSCYELPAGDNAVPECPKTETFKAHTLYSPVYPPGTEPPSKGGRFSRPDPDYAQPSARYLKLITDGADEHSLPEEYKKYLQQLRPYTVTNQKQRLGAFIFGMIWLPFMTLLLRLNNRFTDKKGRAPAWLVAITGAIFRGMWMSYDGFFCKLFGDGERTVYHDNGDDGEGGDMEKGGMRSMDGSLDEKWRDISYVL